MCRFVVRAEHTRENSETMPRFRRTALALGLSTDGTRDKVGSMCSFADLIEDTRENSETAPRFRPTALPLGLSADGTRTKVGSMCSFADLIEDTRENSETAPRFRLSADGTRAKVGSMCSFVVVIEQSSETIPTHGTRVRVLSARLGMLSALMPAAESALERVRLKLLGLVMRMLLHSGLELVLQRAARGVSVLSLLDDDETVRTKRGPTAPWRSAVAMCQVLFVLIFSNFLKC
jgi:predicted GNAT family acetyltransferase